MDHALSMGTTTPEHKYKRDSGNAGEVGDKPGRDFDSTEPVRIVHQRGLKCPKALVVGVVADMEWAGKGAHATIPWR